MPPDMHAVQGLALISERIWGKGRKKGGGDEVGRKGRGWIMNEEGGRTIAMYEYTTTLCDRVVNELLCPTSYARAG